MEIVFGVFCTFLLLGEAYGDGVVILPALADTKNPNKVVTSGSQVSLTCQLEPNELTGPEVKIAWLNANLQPIEGSPVESVFTLKSGRQRILLFNNIRHNDAGWYTCQATLPDSTQLEQRVEIFVVDAVKFTSHKTHEGGLIGEPLIVDCSAEGNPKPKITITGADGVPLPDDRFKLNSHQVEITKLKMEDLNFVIQCSASQVFADKAFTNIETKKVRIEVYYAPKFSTEGRQRYGILERNSSMPCQVLDSNPSVNKFVFYRDDKEIVANYKYKIKTNFTAQRAVLEIDNVKQEDYGKYQCRAFNRKADDTMDIIFSAAVPPGPVKASLEQAAESSILWKLTAAGDPGELPIIEYRVQYMRSEQVDFLIPKNAGVTVSAYEETNVWNKESRRVHFKVAEDNLYRVVGLRPETSYTFRFSAVNEAGWGDDLMQIQGSTAKVGQATAVTDPNNASVNQLSAFLISIIFARMLKSLF